MRRGIEGRVALRHNAVASLPAPARYRRPRQEEANMEGDADGETAEHARPITETDRGRTRGCVPAAVLET